MWSTRIRLRRVARRVARSDSGQGDRSMPSTPSRPLVALAAAVALLAAGAAPADARLPRGYSVFVSASFTIPAGQQMRHELSCPGAKVPLGGGVFIDSAELGANVNGSMPNAT